MPTFQKFFLLVPSTIALALLCFPPWILVFKSFGYSQKPLGHAFLFSPPTDPATTRAFFSVQVDVTTLCIELAILAVAFGIIFVLLKIKTR